MSDEHADDQSTERLPSAVEELNALIRACKENPPVMSFEEAIRFVCAKYPDWCPASAKDES